MNTLEEAYEEAWKRYPAPWDVYEEKPVDDWGYEANAREAFMVGVQWALDLAWEYDNREPREHLMDNPYEGGE